MTLSTQFITILTMMIGGVYLGMAIETFRRFNHFWKKRIIFSYLIEISFWLLQALILFYILYLVNQGELRFYILLALNCGYAAYKSLFENMYKKALEQLIKACISVYHFIYRIIQLLIVKPIKKLLQLLIGLIVSIWGILVWILWMLLKVIWYPIKMVFALIWRLMPQIAKKNIYRLAGFYSKIKNKLDKWWKYFQSKRR